LFLGASTRTNKGVSDPATLEAMASAEAVVLAEDFSVSKLTMAFDCFEVIKYQANEGVFFLLVTEIEIRPRNFELVTIQHEITKGDITG
jgi:hypothetical protein